MKSGSLSGVYLMCGGLFTLAGSVSVATAIILAKNMDAVRQHGTGDVEALPFIFALVGGIALLTGCVILALYLRNYRIRKKLLRDGIYVTADITGFPIDYSVRINRLPTYRIECRWQDSSTNVMHIFRSDTIAFNPEQYVHQNKIRVYVDRSSNYKIYYVDAESVLPEIQRH